MAAMALQLRSKCRTTQNPRFVQHFSSSSSSSSSSSDSNGDDGKKKSQPQPPSPPSPPSVSSYFRDVKDSLRQPQPRKPGTSIEEIRKNLGEFRRQSAAPPPLNYKPTPSSTPTIGFQDLYKRNVIEKNDEGNTNKSGKLSFDSIRESLRQLRTTNPNQPQNDRFRAQDNRSNRVDPYSLKSFRDNLKMNPEGMNYQSKVLGGSEMSPSASFFGKNLGRISDSENQAMKTEFVKVYSYKELGEKLAILRPTDVINKKQKNWFSLHELNERLSKLREMEEKEMENNFGVLIKDLRECLVKLRISKNAKTKQSSMEKLGGLFPNMQTPEYEGKPPKEHLVEQYFHPDNMNSEEKLKLELQKVRDEFKMSESDCGSSRVQVAQLTTKIKHLSSVLHKKDKHSRKGLQEMVEKRKKLIKYLKRTDWDSYCFVLSKLDIKDKPDYNIVNNPNYPRKDPAKVAQIRALRKQKKGKKASKKKLSN